MDIAIEARDIQSLLFLLIDESASQYTDGELNIALDSARICDNDVGCRNFIDDMRIVSDSYDGYSGDMTVFYKQYAPLKVNYTPNSIALQVH